MKYAKRVALMFACIFLLLNVQGQTQFTKYDELPGIIKSYKPDYENDFPVWAKMLYNDTINFKVIDKLFQKEEGRGMEEKEENETDIKRYYIIWRKAVLPYVSKNGSIIIPKDINEIKQRRTGVLVSDMAKQSAASNWIFAGPKETVWEKEQGWTPPKQEAPWQVNIYAFDVSASNNNILYAGSETGFVSKSTDKGLHWQLLGLNYRFGGAVTAIAVHPANPDIVYISAGGQVHKTINGGASWQKTIVSGETFSADRLRIDATNANKIFASANEGLFLSTDGGLNWKKKINLPCFDAEIKPDNPNIVFAITKEKNNQGSNVFHHYLSADGGNNFSLDNNFNFDDKVKNGGLLAVSASSPQYVFAAVLTSRNTPRIYKGTYNNATKKITWQLLVKGKSNKLAADNWQGYYDLVFEVSPADVNTIYFGTSGLYKSSNGGTSFQAIYDYGADNLIQIHPDAQDMKLVNGQEAWVSTDGGFTYTTDGFTNPANSFPRNNLLIGSNFWGYDQGWNEDLMVGGRYHNGNTGMGEYYGDKALRLGGAESATGWVFPGYPRHAVFDDIGGHVLPASVNDLSAEYFSFNKFPNMYYYGDRRGNLFIHPNYYSTFYTGEGNKLWKSTDRGNSFNAIYDFGAYIYYLQISVKNPNVMYADIDGSGLYKSEDGGLHWVHKPAITSGDNYWWPGDLFFVISPYNENVIYACAQGAERGTKKIFKSSNGGDSWVDWTTPVLNDYGTKCLAIQPMPGNKDGIYLFTINSWDGTIGGKVFFRSEDMSDWVDFSNNLPAEISPIHALPFYRDAKLRLPSNAGIWESPLYETNFPVAAINPMVDKNKGYACARDTFYFDDYSIVKHAGAQWAWNFQPAPSYISNINARNPKVVFGKPGKYAVTESIVQNGITYSRTINDMVDISSSGCTTIDTIPGNAAYFSGETYMQIPSFKLPAINRFTFSAWIKPTAIQKDWSGLIMPVGNGFSLNLLPSMELRYGNYWWLETKAFVQPEKWNHIALVVEPDKATIYVNGYPYIINEKNDPAPVTEGIWLGTQEGWGTSRAYTGLMDELCFWNRALKQNEIREYMHLTKNPAEDTSLIHYYQFNESEGNIAYDKTALVHIPMSTVLYNTSSAPVGAGVSKRINVLNAGNYNFGNTGVSINFNQGIIPDGEICVTRINQNPVNSAADNSVLFGKYWLIHNYGKNQSFANINSLQLNDCGIVSAAEIADPAQVKLLKRSDFEDASSAWQSCGTAASVQAVANSSDILFTSPSISSFSQFQLQRTETALAIGAISLQAELSGSNNALLKWQTNDDASAESYVIERCNDGKNFITLSAIQSQKLTGKNFYTYTDIHPPAGLIYYRIKIIHHTKPAGYSRVVTVTIHRQGNTFLLYPNPLNKNNVLHIVSTSLNDYTLAIFNAEGKEVYNKKLSGNADIKLGRQTAGNYFYTILSKEYISHGKIIIQ